jgi:hypothetical protein
MTRGNRPPTQREIARKFDTTASQLRLLLLRSGTMEDKAAFDSYFGQLLTAAQGAFANPGVQADALDGIVRIRAELAQDHGLRIRDAYIKDIARWTLLASAVVVAVLFGCQWWADAARPDEPHYFLNYGIALAASLWGICLGNILSNLGSATLEALVNINLIRPPVRLLVFGGFTAVFILLFYSKVVVAGFGPYTTAQILDNSIMALLMGFGLGVLHLALPTRFEERARMLLGYDKADSMSSTE